MLPFSNPTSARWWPGWLRIWTLSHKRSQSFVPCNYGPQDLPIPPSSAKTTLLPISLPSSLKLGLTTKATMVFPNTPSSSHSSCHLSRLMRRKPWPLPATLCWAVSLS
ncbi:hypothetical protein K457DRAFT_802350 [Linnemannia elongata AG-77]|uniref:Uncharacterized protein n=1 Tax=Linnemannia elongata AG-77 TaxID=1314771 RepID=A0A197JI47_9FUNG|nr:hypothetical protein K457DRAFT_802350 [Linnemannia elongata AG-77]